MASYIYSPYEALIWKLLFNEFHNAFAVAGIMGWMNGESYLVPYTAENDTKSSGLKASATITQRFNRLGLNETGQFSGDYNGAWINDNLYSQYWVVNGRRYGPGYGLAQWTEDRIGSRKSRMYEYWKTRYRAGDRYSIGDAHFQIKWLIYEMKTWFASTYAALKRVNDVRRAMYIYGLNYEAGGNVAWTNDIVADRIYFGVNLYNKYSGATPVDPPDPGIPVPPDPTPNPDPIPPEPGQPDTTKIPLWMLIDYNR